MTGGGVESSGVARIFKRGGGGGVGAKRGREDREISENSCIKIAFFAH